MSIAHLTEASPPPRSTPRDRAARDRLISLVGQIDGEGLDVAEEVLAGVIAHQRAGTRGLTDSELSVLARLGVSEEELREPSSLPAASRGRMWERQAEQNSLSVAEAAEMLGVTPARVRQRCAAGSLLAQRRSDGWRLPALQFPEGREPRGWSVVARAIPPGTPLLLVERVLTSPAARLNADGEELAPLEWLDEGGDPETAAAAVDDALNRLP